MLKCGIGGNIRIPLNSPKVIGVANDRGNRGCVVTEFLPSPPTTHKDGSSGFSRHQEDYYGVAALSLDPWELQKTARKNFKEVWDPTLVSDFMSRQVLFVGVYDGYVDTLLQAIR
jgi:protein phosphatase PTC6